MAQQSTKQRGSFGKLFLEPPPKTRIKNESFIKKQFKIFQPLIFVALYLLYFSSYLGRKQLSLGFQGARSNGLNGIEDIYPQLGALYGTLLMVYYLSYAVGKIIGGIIADKTNLRIMLPLSVGIAALLPLGIIGGVEFYSANGSIVLAKLIMIVSWGLSGFIQAASFPLCGKALTYWFSNKNRATVWSFWSTSHELGASASFVLSWFLIKSYGWEWVFIGPAMISVLVAIFGLIVLREKPVTMGLPDVETYAGCAPKKEEEEKDTDTRTYGQVFFQDIFKNKTIWILALCFICVYIIRSGPVDWMVKAFENDPKVVGKTTIVPVFGALGTLSIPVVSNHLFKGRRAPALFLYFLVSTICFSVIRLVTPFDGHAIIALPESTVDIIQWIALPLLGIATYGPLVMIGGVASIESASKRVAAATTGFTGGIGYVGAIFISYFGKFAQKNGNFGMLFSVMLGASALATVLITLLWNQQASKDYNH